MPSFSLLWSNSCSYMYLLFGRPLSAVVAAESNVIGSLYNVLDYRYSSSYFWLEINPRTFAE